MTSHYSGPSIDHSLLSPSGRISKRARAAAVARDEARISAWFAKKYPPDSPEVAETKRIEERRAACLCYATKLRDLAARGMNSRKFTKEADRLEAEAASLGTPEVAPR